MECFVDGLGAAENIGDFPLNHCKYFVVDYFGTQSLHNNRNINLKQILTPYAYDGSNTAIHMVTAQLPRSQWSSIRERKGVLWSKDSAAAFDLQDLLRQVSAVMPIQTTFAVGASAKMRYGPNISHLGYMKNSSAYLQLLTSSRYLLGVGLPLVGPTALEAIAHGCVYINPIFNPPRTTGKARTKYAYTSQHPFVAEHIPEPYAFTIDSLTNWSELDQVLQFLQSRGDGEYSSGFVHPSHTPLGYVQNLYSVFSSMLADQFVLSCRTLRPGGPASPRGHPGNKVYRDFVEYVKNKCNRYTCTQRLRLVSYRTYDLIDRWIPSDRQEEYYEAVYDPEVDIEDHNDMWQKGHRHVPDVGEYSDRRIGGNRQRRKSRKQRGTAGNNMQKFPSPRIVHK